MKKLFISLFSVTNAGFLLLLLAFALGFATFVENVHGTEAARALVYNSHWLELILLMLTIGTVYSFVRFKLYTKEKFSIGLFHMAFIFILIGAGVTRYFGEEGMMHIREGETANEIVSIEQYFHAEAVTNEAKATIEQPVQFSQFSKSEVSAKINLGDKSIKIESVDYLQNVRQALVAGDNSEPMIELVFADNQSMRSEILRKGETYNNGATTFGFDNEADVRFELSGDSLVFMANDTVKSVVMQTNSILSLEPEKINSAATRTVYHFKGSTFVIKNYLQSGTLSAVPGDGSANDGKAVKIRVNSGGKQQIATVWDDQSGGQKPTSFVFEGVDYKMWLAPKKIQLPFSIKLNDFVLERYPGSNSPSSYESKVVLIDTEKGIEREERIFMNNVLKNRGYRFYQSSYDSDEKGTILSVNKDLAGTWLTYLGYILLFLGILFSIFNPKSYFFQLMKKASVPITILLFLFGFGNSQAAETKSIPRSSAMEFAKVLVQGHDGRVKPFSTLAYETVMKMSRSEKVDGMVPEQVVLGMASDPQIWQSVPVIAVSDSKLKDLLGITSGKAAYADFFNDKGIYKLSQAVNEAYGKRPASRGTFDNAVIKTDERLNVAYMIFKGDLFKFFPSKGADDHHWQSPNSAKAEMFGADSLLVAYGFSDYLQALHDGNSEIEKGMLTAIKDYQQQYGNALIPPKGKQQLEILYNHVNIFKDLSALYLLCGFAALFFFFRALLTDKQVNRKGIKVVFWFFVLGFVLHTVGLAIRGYISGHMPWSDGYESMIYIAWAGMLAGLVFARRNPMVLGAAAILSGLTLFVAQMSWLNPEITNLVPVLKSYWLTFHVAIITASYGFVGVCALIGLLNLVMASLRTAKNSYRIDRNIQQMTMISQAAMILGLYFLTIGTFLGAIWANESWGRYWGWDPKETWSLVTILVYAFITHMRLMPGFRGWFAFNLASVIGLLSVLMTYLGVNYYLSGLHSYGSGSGLSFPIMIVALFSVIGIIAYLAWRKVPIEIKPDNN